MFCTTTLGWPGRYLLRNGAISRPDASVPPPGSEPTSTVMVLPLNDSGSCAAAPNEPMAAAVIPIRINRPVDANMSLPPWRFTHSCGGNVAHFHRQTLLGQFLDVHAMDPRILIPVFDLVAAFL